MTWRQILTRITNRGSRDYKKGQLLGITNQGIRDYKSGQVQRLQNGVKWLQIGAGITKRGRNITYWGRHYKSGHGLQIVVEQLLSLDNFDKFSFQKRRLKIIFSANQWAAIWRIFRICRMLPFDLLGKILLIPFLRINKFNAFVGNLPREN